MTDKKNYKLAVFSDTHGKWRNIEKVLPIINECDYFIYLGDGNRDVNKVQDRITTKIVRVTGNCDCMPDLPAETVLQVGNVNFLIAHGHMYGVKSGLLRYALRARERDCAYAVYGHTHGARISEDGGVTLINPGAGSGGMPSFARITGNGVVFGTEIIRI